MYNANAPMVWALLMPIDAEHLADYARVVWEREYGGLEQIVPPWEVIQGKAAYSALIDRDPGSEGTDERLAEEFTRERPGTLYLLRFREDLEVVWAYEQGRFVQAVPENPYALAERLQCPLRTTPVEDSVQVTRSVCVVEGATASAVAHALGFATPPQGPLHVDQTKNGVLVYSERGGAAIFLHELSEALPDATVYRVVTGPEPDRFGVLVVKGETDIGIFELPELEELTAPRLDSIKGETEPAKIAAALGIPLKLLGLDRTY